MPLESIVKARGKAIRRCTKKEQRRISKLAWKTFLKNYPTNEARGEVYKRRQKTRKYCNGTAVRKREELNPAFTSGKMNSIAKHGESNWTKSWQDAAKRAKKNRSSEHILAQIVDKGNHDYEWRVIEQTKSYSPPGRPEGCYDAARECLSFDAQVWRTLDRTLNVGGNIAGASTSTRRSSYDLHGCELHGVPYLRGKALRTIDGSRHPPGSKHETDLLPVWHVAVSRYQGCQTCSPGLVHCPRLYCESAQRQGCPLPLHALIARLLVVSLANTTRVGLCTAHHESTHCTSPGRRDGWVRACGRSNTGHLL